MTVTISRLYDNPTDAQRAVARLEAAGVPHSDVSIVANNSDSWFNSDAKVDRDRDGVDDRTEGSRQGCWPGRRGRRSGGPTRRLRFTCHPWTRTRGCRWLAGCNCGWSGCRSSDRRSRWKSHASRGF